MNKLMRVPAVVLTAATLLAACGGGGGSSGGGGLAARLSRDAGEVQNRIRSALPGLVSNARMSFGSVVAAAGATVTGIDTDFSDGRATVRIQRRGKSAISLDTANAYNDLGETSSLVGLTGRRSRTRAVFTSDADSATAGVVAIDWNSDDTTDYLAGGYWIHVEASPASLEFGAFVDGPELDIDNPPSLPVTGTADYAGAAAGLYATEAGTDIPGVTAGTAEVGEFSGLATLTANFGTGTISGCVGCFGSVDLTPAGGYTYATNYRVHLGAAPIARAQGTFRAANVTVSNPDIPISRSSGVWGGQFSNRLDGGDPRLAAGTFAGQAATPGGSRGVFVGAFAAGKN